MTTTAPTAPATYTPTRPHLAALAFVSLWILILSLPMWTGQFLAGPDSDMYSTGYALRAWGAELWRATGHPPVWNPEMMGGVPIAAGFGDVYYPTALSRLVLPTVTAINLGFVVHYVLAGFFTYLLLRMLNTSWLGAVLGGVAYQLSGVVASLARPGHDGKLFVTALLPLMLIALIIGIRRQRWEGHLLLALCVGLAILSPQYQMAYYSFIIAGIFALYLTVGEPEGLPVRARYTGLGLAFGAVLLGFGIAMIQILPFYIYLPYSPRAAGMAGGFETATSYAIPWAHVPEFFVSAFTGVSATYWGPNHLKYHSEYLGLSVVPLALLGAGLGAGAGGKRRTLVRWLLGIGLLFLLISLGAATPFYRLWWAVMPYVKQTRAPGMAFFAVAFVVALLAAFGVERLEQRVGRRLPLIGWITAGVIALLAATGALGAVAHSLARAQGPGGLGAAEAAQSGILGGALGSAVALAALAGLVAAFFANRLNARAFAIGLLLVVGMDLWLDARHFWLWSRPDEGIYRRDALVRQMQQVPLPYRIFDYGPVYPGTTLMKHNIPQVLGYHGNEIQYYDELLGGKNQWRHLSNLRLWDLLAIRFLIIGDSARVPGYHRAAGPVETAAGRIAYLYEADTAPAYARVVPAAFKLDSAAIVPTIQDPRFDADRVLLLAPDAPVNPAPMTALPAPSPARAIVTTWAPGRMSIALDPPPPTPSYVLVSENWYIDWRARVDGVRAEVLRGDHTFIAVPVAAGARTVELWIESASYEQGRLITFLSLGILALLAIGPATARRFRRG